MILTSVGLLTNTTFISYDKHQYENKEKSIKFRKHNWWLHLCIQCGFFHFYIYFFLGMDEISIQDIQVECSHSSFHGRFQIDAMRFCINIPIESMNRFLFQHSFKMNMIEFLSFVLVCSTFRIDDVVQCHCHSHWQCLFQFASNSFNRFRSKWETKRKIDKKITENREKRRAMTTTQSQLKIHNDSTFGPNPEK